jgi:uncharacterized protein
MKTREDIIQTLAKEKPILEKEFQVHSLALFGSYARGEQNKSSDVDVLVDVDPSIGLRFVTLAETIEKALGVRVDLVSRRAINIRHWKVIEPEVIYVKAID